MERINIPTTLTDQNNGEVIRFKEEEIERFVKNIDRRIMLYRFVYRVIYKEQRTVIIVIEGERGTGKSYLALKLASALDISWTVHTQAEADAIVRERVVVKPSQYIELVNSANLRRGSVIILDEAGVGIPAREWQTINNRAISYLTQVFRHKGLIVILTVPSWEFIDVQIREAINIRIKTLFVDRRGKTVTCKVMQVMKDESRATRQDIRFIYFRWGSLRFKRNRFHKVNRLIAIAYETYSLQFKEGLERELEAKIKRSEAPDTRVKEKEQQGEDFLKRIVDNPRGFCTFYHGRTIISATKIRSKLGVSRNVAEDLKIKAEEKIAEMGIKLDVTNL